MKVVSLAIEWLPIERHMRQALRRAAGRLSRFDAPAAWPASALQPPCGSIVTRGGKLKRRSTMLHSNTELLIDYWRGRRGGRPMPRRADIDPTGFAALAPQAFIALREPSGDVSFRLA